MEPITIDEAQAWYPNVDPVHGFDHVLRVYRTARHLAQLENADLEIVLAAALLHDARGSAHGGEDATRSEHHIASAAFAGEILQAKGWPGEKISAVQHCIRAHRFRKTEDAPQTIEAKVLFDADKLDVLGAIGAARTIAYAALDGQPPYAEPSEKFLQTGEKLGDEPHSSYHEFLFKLCNVKNLMFTHSGKSLAETRHQYLLGFYKQLQAEVRGER